MLNAPVRMTESAVSKLPRWVLLLVLIAYALPGLFGRDPWRSDDAAGFGAMLTMAEGGLRDWLMPNVFGDLYLDNGPLFFWLGALSIKLFGWLVSADEAARVATLLVCWFAARSVWYAAYWLARRPEVQPQQFAFGGHPDARSYGRALADGAVLLGTATFGLLMRAHESSSQIAHLSMLAFGLYALVQALERPLRGAVNCGLAIGGLVLIGGPPSGLSLLAAALAAAAISKEWRRLGPQWYLLATLIAAGLLSVWCLAVLALPGGNLYLKAWFGVNDFNPWLLSWRTWVYYLRNLPWFLWPAWPMALWAAWIWRHHRSKPQFALPAAGLIGGLLYLAVGHGPSDSAMLMLLPPTLLLGAFALPVLRPGAANLIDWFAVMNFSLLAAFVWLAWLALLIGWPEALARAGMRTAPGFNFAFNAIDLGIALMGTGVWIWLVRWRLATRPTVLWRSTVLSASGIALVWLLALTLMLPYVDYLKTYRYVAVDIAKQLPRGACVQATQLGYAQRASLVYFERLSLQGDERCGWLLRHRSGSEQFDSINTARWKLIWEGHRASDRGESFELYKRTDAR